MSTRPNSPVSRASLAVLGLLLLAPFFSLPSPKKGTRKNRILQALQFLSSFFCSFLFFLLAFEVTSPGKNLVSFSSSFSTSFSLSLFLSSILSSFTLFFFFLSLLFTMKTARKFKRKEDRERRKGRRDRPSDRLSSLKSSSSFFSTSSHDNRHRDDRARRQVVSKRTNLDLSSSSSSSSCSSSSSLPSKKKKKGGSSGAGSSFRVLGLSSYTSHAAVKKLGYNQPTPIQRRSIPILLKGRDCIIKSRTGSGKTCAYLLPLIDLLQSHSSIVGARGLIIVPTRELVYQISSLVSRLFRDTSLRYASLIGGLNLEKQFQALSNNPDVLIATVGRITQLVQEKVLSLRAVHYLVLDEADRMFELGWGTDELRIIWNNISSSSFSPTALPSSSLDERRQKDLTAERGGEGGGEGGEDFFVLRGRCQAIIVSATLPSRLAEFSRLGLNNPELIQLDKELTLSEHLELRFLFVRTSQKIPCLLFLLSQHANKVCWKPTQRNLLMDCCRPRYLSIYLGPSLSLLLSFLLSPRVFLVLHDYRQT